ncbi:MAG: zf-HC2 domain-containing protein [Defluviitaleaceae bacterium]|nr:zf-HC2 domain-containing protein [Defluviitaleaceae bacterium]
MDNNDFSGMERMLSLYIDGELAPKDIEWVEKALKNSPELQREYELLRELITNLNQTEEIEPPNNFHQMMMAGIERETRKTRKNYQLYRFVANAATILLLILTTFGIGISGSMQFAEIEPVQEIIPAIIGFRAFDISTDEPPIDINQLLLILQQDITFEILNIQLNPKSEPNTAAIVFVTFGSAPSLNWDLLTNAENVEIIMPGIPAMEIHLLRNTVTTPQ